MSYSKTFTEKKYLQIAAILKKLQSLQEGETLLVKDLAGGQVLRVRWLLYDWLRQQGLKPAFVIKVEGNILSIKKKEIELGSIEVTNAPLSSKNEALLGETFLHFDTEEKVVEFLKKQEISEESQKQILALWKRVMD